MSSNVIWRTKEICTLRFQEHCNRVVGKKIIGRSKQTKYAISNIDVKVIPQFICNKNQSSFVLVRFTKFCCSILSFGDVLVHYHYTNNKGYSNTQKPFKLCVISLESPKQMCHLSFLNHSK